MNTYKINTLDEVFVLKPHRRVHSHVPSVEINDIPGDSFVTPNDIPGDSFVTPMDVFNVNLLEQLEELVNIFD
jgi:hypothetical protein